MADSNRGKLSAYERTFLFIAIVVTTIWALATVVQIAIPSRPAPEYANIVMVTVAGCFFGGAFITRHVNARRNGREEDPYEDESGYYRRPHQ